MKRRILLMSAVAGLLVTSCITSGCMTLRAHPMIMAEPVGATEARPAPADMVMPAMSRPAADHFMVAAGLAIAPSASPVPEPARVVVPGPMPTPAPRQPAVPGGESYEPIWENFFRRVADEPLSTFSIDVDTASYANVRRYLTQNCQLPPRDAVRVEEMINYFPYSYRPPETDRGLFAVMANATVCPWNPRNRLVRIAIKGSEMDRTERPPSNLVFLLDVSGSMSDRDKLPMLKRAMEMMTAKLEDTDRVAIVVYASQSGVLLDSTPCTALGKRLILDKLDGLQAAGSTQASAGIRDAYEVASRNFIKGGTNRVILATDGDFNVGITNPDDLVRLVRDHAERKIFLTILGVGQGNLKDATMQKLADKGNGNYAYLDSLEEARKVLLRQMSATLVTIAKDVKIQVEFNPAAVDSYRLIGYEKRALVAQDFNNDRKDAGEIGAGHCVTAFYEVVTAGEPSPRGRDEDDNGRPAIEPLKYQPNPRPRAVTVDAPPADEMLTVKLRYKLPEGDTSRLVEMPVHNEAIVYSKADPDFRFAASVAQFAMLLRNSPYREDANYDAVIEEAESSLGSDPDGYRAEFVNLVKEARRLSSEGPR